MQIDTEIKRPFWERLASRQRRFLATGIRGVGCPRVDVLSFGYKDNTRLQDSCHLSAVFYSFLTRVSITVDKLF